jgi:hypothetical protein
MEAQLMAHPQFHRPATAAQFAGQVTVDAQPPSKDCTLFVILHRPDHLDEAAHMRGKGYQLYARCDPEGNFKFRNGVEPGKYVLSFVELHSQVGKKSGGGFGVSHGGDGNPRDFLRPDELKNLYNDPDENVKEQAFNLNLAYPGTEDYHLDLAVAGKDGVDNPGANAIVGTPAK